MPARERSTPAWAEGLYAAPLLPLAKSSTPGGGNPPGYKRAVFLDSNIEELSLTINTQPCLFAMDLACAAALAEAGVHAAGGGRLLPGRGRRGGLLRPACRAADAFQTLSASRAELDGCQCSQAHPGAMAAIVKARRRSRCEVSLPGDIAGRIPCQLSTARARRWSRAPGRRCPLSQLEQDVSRRQAGGPSRWRSAVVSIRLIMEKASERPAWNLCLAWPFRPARPSPLCQCNCRFPILERVRRQLLSRQVKEPRFSGRKPSKRCWQSGVTVHLWKWEREKRSPDFMRKITKNAKLDLQCGIARNAAGGSISIERRKQHADRNKVALVTGASRGIGKRNCLKAGQRRPAWISPLYTLAMPTAAEHCQIRNWRTLGVRAEGLSAAMFRILTAVGELVRHGHRKNWAPFGALVNNAGHYPGYALPCSMQRRGF